MTDKTLELLEFHVGRVFEFMEQKDSLVVIITGDLEGHHTEFWYRYLGSKMATIGVLEEWLMGNLRMPPTSRSNIGDRIAEGIRALSESDCDTVLVLATFQEGNDTKFLILGTGNALAQRASARKVLQALTFTLPLQGEQF